MFQIIALLMLFFWIAFGLLIALVLWIAIFGDHRNEIIMVLVQRTDEMETGIPSEHDGKNKLYPLYPVTIRKTMPTPSTTKLHVLWASQHI